MMSEGETLVNFLNSNSCRLNEWRHGNLFSYVSDGDDFSIMFLDVLVYSKEIHGWREIKELRAFVLKQANERLEMYKTIQIPKS